MAKKNPNLTGTQLEETINLLRDDANYYGKFGKKYLSNSDIITLLKDPQSFGKEKEQTLPMLQGSYLHTAILEPQKIDNFQIVDMASRNSKAYKEMVAESGVPRLLLQKEKEELDLLVNAIIGNREWCGMLIEDANIFEQPGIAEIHGMMWKGKCDVLGSDKLIDIKTTSDIDRFEWSAKTYNYDCQCVIYEAIFGKPMHFMVIEKGTCRMDLIDCSDDFRRNGERKIKEAIQVFNDYFVPDAPCDITQYFRRKTL